MIDVWATLSSEDKISRTYMAIFKFLLHPKNDVQSHLILGRLDVAINDIENITRCDKLG